jgi:hypothetical protein
MAKLKFSTGIDQVFGALDSKHELIVRQKHLHAPDGSLTKQCKPEGYFQAHKRDYKQNPPTGRELAHLQRFGQASLQTTALLKAMKNPDQATPEQRAQVADFKARFQAQIKGDADPQAPRDKSGKLRHYYRIDTFIRAILYQALEA